MTVIIIIIHPGLPERRRRQKNSMRIVAGVIQQHDITVYFRRLRAGMRFDTWPTMRLNWITERNLAAQQGARLERYEGKQGRVFLKGMPHPHTLTLILTLTLTPSPSHPHPSPSPSPSP